MSLKSAKRKGKKASPTTRRVCACACVCWCVPAHLSRERKVNPALLSWTKMLFVCDLIISHSALPADCSPNTVTKDTGSGASFHPRPWKQRYRRQQRLLFSQTVLLSTPSVAATRGAFSSASNADQPGRCRLDLTASTAEAM